MSDTIDIQDLKPADILLFAGEKGDFLSEAIMFLTNSTVSHAAMASGTAGEIVEEVGSGAGYAPAAERFKGRDIYVNRRDDLPPAAPVLAAAKLYVDKKTPYAFGNLLLVGLILIYKKITPSSLLQRVMIKIYKKLASEIITWVNQGLYPGKLPMFCSQFVYQCYEDAGAGYRLKIKDGTLVGGPALLEEVAMSLLDQVILQARSDKTTAFVEYLSSPEVTTLTEVPSQTEEELARELMEVLSASGDQALFAAAADAKPEQAPSRELAAAAYQFAEAWYMAQGGVETANFASLAAANQKGLSPDALNFLKAEESYFVTPADLLDKCTNTTRIGEIPG